MAPFATFFLVVYIILHANKIFSPSKRIIFYTLFFSLSLIESYNAEVLINLRNYATSPMKSNIDSTMTKVDFQVEALCQRGYLDMSPAFNKNFLNLQIYIIVNFIFYS